MTERIGDRQLLAQRPPDAAVALQRFPVRRLSRATVAYRAHRSDRGPWWFGADGFGRFDLEPPSGTCYLAESRLVALRERLGIVLGSALRVPTALLDGVVVSTLALPHAVDLANLRSAKASDFGVLNELATMVPYDVPQQWARALAAAGHDGVRYPARFTPGRPGAVALFGAAGPQQQWPVDPAPLEALEVPGCPAAVGPPRLDELTVVRTPRRRPDTG